jgi:hypothetical protein
MKADEEIVSGWEHPGARITIEYRRDELWHIEETAYTEHMLLMDEYNKTVGYCIKHGLPLPKEAPPESASNDKMIIAIRIRESFVRMLTPAEIAVRSRSQPISDE